MTMLIVNDAYNKWLRPFYLMDLSDYYICKEPLLQRAISGIKCGNAMTYMYDDVYEYGTIEEVEILPQMTA